MSLEVSPQPGSVLNDNYGRQVEANNSSLKVLIIDDNPVDREIFKRYLGDDLRENFIYAEADTARDGLRQLKDFQPDCVLLDFQLPDLDGLGMIRLLRDSSGSLPCAVVMLTGIGSEKIAVDAMKLGATDYLAKGPASAEALARTVANAVQRFHLQQEIARHRHALEQRNLELEATRAEVFAEKERYRTMAEAIPQLLWTADSEGRLEYGNQRLWQFSGKPAGDASTLEGLVHPDDKPTFQNRWNEGTRSGNAFECELRLRRAHDQTWRVHLMRTAPVRPIAGSFKWFGTFTDIEEQKRSEEALRQRQKLDSIGSLAGGIAHDFNNLLVGIMGGASFALDSLENTNPVYPMLEIILRSSERAAHLTQQLLAYAGRGQAAIEPVNITRIARDACELVRSSIQANVRLSLEADDDIPPVETNTGQMHQVIINLLMNAAEAMGQKESVIFLRIVRAKVGAAESRVNVLGYPLPAGNYVQIEVVDSGCGMDEQTRAQIFDPFFTTKFTGRGLGLAAVQGIVRKLGGAIFVISAPGKGSTFRVLLPALPPGAPGRTQADRRSEKPSAA